MQACLETVFEGHLLSMWSPVEEDIASPDSTVHPEPSQPSAMPATDDTPEPISDSEPKPAREIEPERLAFVLEHEPIPESFQVSEPAVVSVTEGILVEFDRMVWSPTLTPVTEARTVSWVSVELIDELNVCQQCLLLLSSPKLSSSLLVPPSSKSPSSWMVSPSLPSAVSLQPLGSSFCSSTSCSALHWSVDPSAPPQTSEPWTPP